MGMYDNIKCNYTLPDEHMQEEGFQTKDLDNCLENYTITSSGTLVLHSVRYEEVPEEERHYYGTPEWDEKPLLRMAGCLRSIPTGEIEVCYDGPLTFYTCVIDENTYETMDAGNGGTIDVIGPSTEREWFEYCAWFKDGKLTKMEKVEERVYETDTTEEV